MKHLAVGFLVAGLVVGGTSSTAPTAQAADRKGTTFQSNRAGWMLGMYIGEEDVKPFPCVLEVDPKSDAKAKGIRPGDELIKFQEQETRPLKRVFEAAQKLRPGREVTVWMRRGAQTLRFDLRVQPPVDPAAEEAAKAEAEKAAAKTEGAEGEGAKKKRQRRIIIKPIPSTDPTNGR